MPPKECKNPGLKGSKTYGGGRKGEGGNEELHMRIAGLSRSRRGMSWGKKEVLDS